LRVLVTGATGLAGSHSVAAIRAAGHDVRAFVRTREKCVSVLGRLGLAEGSGLEIFVGDLGDRGRIKEALTGCDALVHAAAFFTQDTRRREEVERTNVDGARSVLSLAVENGLDPVIHVSSIAALFPPDGARFAPDDAVKTPRDMYAKSKADAERFARELQAAGAPIVCVYPGTLMGPEDPTFGDGLQTIMGFVRRGFIPVTPGGIPIVDVRDLARLHSALLEPGQGPRRFMLGGHFLNNQELADVLARVTGRRMRTLSIPVGLIRAVGRAGDWVQRRFGITPGLTHEATLILTEGVPSDDSRARDELGIEARSVEETLADTLRWMYEEGKMEARHVGALATLADPEG